MLFDLRSRGRRRAVKVIYLGLALLMIAGLVLVGVGTGSGGGGLLNAFNNGGSGSGGSQLADQQLNRAIKATKKNPKSAARWGSLMQARWSAASSGSNYNSTNGTFSAQGLKQLRGASAAWQQYLKLSGGKPAVGYAQLAAGVYQATGKWAEEANAWNYVAQAEAGSKQALTPYLCLSFSAYAAKQTTKGDLAAAQAVKLSPKLQRLTYKSALHSAKASTTTAEQLLAQYC